MTCDKCGGPMRIEVEFTGGCQGGHGEDDRCYCDSPDVRCRWRCDGGVTNNIPAIRTKPVRWCGYTKAIHELGDQYAIQRWLNENYEGIFMRVAREAAARERDK